MLEIGVTDTTLCPSSALAGLTSKFPIHTNQLCHKEHSQIYSKGVGGEVGVGEMKKCLDFLPLHLSPSGANPAD